MSIRALLRHSITALVFLVHSICIAQCPISAPKILCMGDVGYFSIQIPSGSTLVSADWNFGDGYTTTGQNPGHLFAKSGTFLVKCKLSLSGGASCQDSVSLKVLALPTANFTFSQKDTCLNNNRICLTNKSVPANSKQPIVKNLAIWGDGGITNINSNKCYTYKQYAPYKLTLEVTDSMGCKDLKSATINIAQGVVAAFKDSLYPACGSTKLCLTNTSDTALNNTNKYTWQFNNGNPITTDYKTPQCLTFKKYTELNVKYKISNGNGCRDSFKYTYKINVDSFENYKLSLSKASLCYGDYIPFTMSISPRTAAIYKWIINLDTFSTDSFSAELLPRREGYGPGKYTLKCLIEKGACKILLDTIINIKGPRAKVRIFNQSECNAGNVYFVDSTEVVNYKKSSRIWILEDEYGDSCISNREKDINKYKNCNYSTDWFHKHKYTVNRPKNKVLFYIHDSITGCSDTARLNVNTKACSFTKKDTVCQGALYIKNYQGRKPYMFSLDSGKAWTFFPGTLDPALKGLYSLSLMYEIVKKRAIDYGDDSIKILKDTTYFEYLYLKNQLFIKPNPDPTFNYTTTTDCIKRKVVLKLNDPQLYANEMIVIGWGNNEYDTIRPTINYKFDSIIHWYGSSVMTTITLTRGNIEGCFSQYNLALEFGKNMYLKIEGGPCLRNKVCIKTGVYDLLQGKEWTSANKLGTIKIVTGDGKEFYNDYSNPCYQFTTPGMKRIILIATGGDGCKDSISEYILVNDLKAGITENSKVFGCGEIKQLFDSSKLFYLNEDMIVKYQWDFGAKTYAVTEKDPYYTFAKFGKYQVIHIVTSKLGCTDTIKFTVNVEGPDPQFDILTDTIGCEPLVVKFRNNSKNCSQYYWRFGDPAQNTLLNNSSADVTFTYTTPGKYYIKLIGIDSFYSTATQSTYFCKQSFPEDTTLRSVTVLPVMKAAFESPDTVCVGEDIGIKNLSDPRFTTLHWDMGDGTKKSKPNTATMPYSYTKSGTYKITLKPAHGYPICNDSAEKLITAKGVLAGFQMERFCESPLLNFINTSVPDDNSTTYAWNFGQPDKPLNESSQKNPMHDYGLNKGTFMVCLRLQDRYGCADSMCETFINDYSTKLIIPNVFTPGVTDNKNDEYDIVMMGEEIYELSIFNRWGQLVYQSNTDGEPGQNINWNGRFNNNGPELPEGTYFYIFDYKNCYGDLEKKRATGAITLIR